MVGLLDIAPSSEEVMVGGKPVAIYAVNARGVAYLLSKYPELRMVLTGKDVDETKLIAMAPDALASIIAAGLGAPGDKAMEKRADQLGVGEQLAIVSAIWRQTFPNGVSPFMEELQRMGILDGGVVSGKVPASKSQPPSKG